MESLGTYLLSILALTILSGGWVGVQLLAHKMKTKNHIDHAGECGNGCTCMGITGECKKEQ